MKAKRLLTLLVVLATLCLGVFALVACNPSQDETPSDGTKKLLSLSLEQKPTKLVYEIGETVDTSGMKVVAKFNDNSSADVTSECTTSLDGQKIKADTISYYVQYTYEKVKKTARVDITVNKEDVDISELTAEEFTQPYIVAQQSSADYVFMTSVDSSSMCIDGTLELVGTLASGTFTYTERNDYLGEITNIDGTPVLAPNTPDPLSEKCIIMTGSYSTTDGEMALKTKTVKHMRSGRVDNATVQNATIIYDKNDPEKIVGLNFGSMVKTEDSALFFGWGKANGGDFKESYAQNFGLDPFYCCFGIVENGEIPADMRVYHAPVKAVTIETNPDKTEYKMGESFDTHGMSLFVEYEAGRSTTVTDGFTASPSMFNEEGDEISVVVTYYGYFSTAFKCDLTVSVVNLYESGVYAIRLLDAPTDIDCIYNESLDDALRASTMGVRACSVETDIADKDVDNWTVIGYDAEGNAIEGNKVTNDLKYYIVSYTETVDDEDRVLEAKVNVNSIVSKKPYRVALYSKADHVFYNSFELSGRSNNKEHDMTITLNEGNTPDAGEFDMYVCVTNGKLIYVGGTYVITDNTISFTALNKLDLEGTSTMYSAIDTEATLIKDGDKIIGLEFGAFNGIFGLSYDKAIGRNIAANALEKESTSACFIAIENNDMKDYAGYYDKYVRAESIRFTIDGEDQGDTITVSEQNEVQILAGFTPGETSIQKVSWRFSAEGVQDPVGVYIEYRYSGDFVYITGLKPGTVTVTAIPYDNPQLARSFELVITSRAVSGVTLDKSTLSLVIDSESTLTATIAPSDAFNSNVTWSSSNEEVATVDQTGKITAVAAGEAVITVTTEDGGFTATCTVTVTAEAVRADSVTISGEGLAEGEDGKYSFKLTKGDEKQLTASVLPATVTNTNVVWSSSDATVATVDGDGKVTAVAPGTAVITATSEDNDEVSDCVTVTVPAVVTLDKTTVTLGKGYDYTLVASIEPEDYENKEFTWSTDDDEVATVDSDGKVTAVGAGTAIVRATLKDDETIFAQCVVNVNAGYKTLKVINAVREFPFNVTSDVKSMLESRIAASDMTVVIQYYDKDIEDVVLTLNAETNGYTVTPCGEDGTALASDKISVDLKSYIIKFFVGEEEKTWRIGDKANWGDGELTIVKTPYDIAKNNMNNADLVFYNWWHRQSNVADTVLELYYGETENAGTFRFTATLNTDKKQVIANGTYTIAESTISFAYNGMVYNPTDSGFFAKDGTSAKATVVRDENGKIKWLNFGTLGASNADYFQTGSKNWTDKNCQTDDSHENGSIGEVITGSGHAEDMYMVNLDVYTGEVKSNYSENVQSPNQVPQPPAEIPQDPGEETEDLGD